MHGWQSHSGIWKVVVHLFPTSEYTFYAFDAPGHGQSDGKFLSAVLYGEIIKQFGEQFGKLDAIIAHSLGAFSALFAISKFDLPKTEQLVIMGTPGKAEDLINHFKQRLQLNNKVLVSINKYFKTKTGFFFEDLSISLFAKQIDQQGIIIHDRNDRFAPFSYAEELNRKWTNSNLIVTNGLGHNLLSDEVNKEILDFVNR